MPAISRQIGNTSEYLPVFIADATVSTGAGLANVVASSVSLSWFRNDMSAVSTQTLTTGTLGTFATSSFTQASSTAALGWYGVSIPNGVFVSGRSASVHLYGAPNMAPVPIIVELTKTDNQTYLSSSVVSTVLNSLGADMRLIYGTAPVTTSPGILASVFDLGRTVNATSTVVFSGLTISASQNVSTLADKANFTLAAAYDPAKTAAQAGDAMTLTAAYNAAKTAAAATDIVTAGAINTAGGVASADVKKVNNVTVNGAGTAGNPWGP